jgi:Prokaryotic homologs of the JAB domain
MDAAQQTRVQIPRAAVVRVNRIPPRFRQRPVEADAGFVGFARERGAPVVFVHRQVLHDVAAHAQSALPNEAIGLLYGRSWQDGQGLWVVINRFIAPDDGGAELTPGHCTLTAYGSATLQRQAELRYLIEEYGGGWAHSHVNEESSFSALDFEHQAKKSTEAVGLLAYPRRGRWAFTVYLGPESAKLSSDQPHEVFVAEIDRAVPVPTPERSIRPRRLASGRPIVSSAHSSQSAATIPHLANRTFRGRPTRSSPAAPRVRCPAAIPQDAGELFPAVANLVLLMALVLLTLWLDGRLEAIDARLTVAEEQATTTFVDAPTPVSDLAPIQQGAPDTTKWAADAAAPPQRQPPLPWSPRR